MQTFFNQNLVHSALHIARYQRGTFEVHLQALNLLIEQFETDDGLLFLLPQTMSLLCMAPV